VIFVSIDDHEVENLKKVCIEVFGEENHLAACIWQHSVQPKGYSGTFSIHHNYLLVFQKSEDFMLCDLERTEEHNKNYSNPDSDPNGPWRTGDVRNALYRPNLIFDIGTPSGKTIKPPPNGWRWSKETIQRKIQTGEIIFSPDETRIIRKIYLKNLEGRTPETILFGKDVGTTRDAAGELKGLFDGEVLFDTAKPTALVRHMLNLAGVQPGDTILDFFAGSGATAHAVLDLNKQDGGNRSFVLVQLPEPLNPDDKDQKLAAEFCDSIGRPRNIAEVTKERVRRVIKKLNDVDLGKLNLEGKAKQDRGFRVFRLAESNLKPWNAEVPHDQEALAKQLDLHVDHIREDRTTDDLLYEILLKSGFPLSTPVDALKLASKAVYSVAGGSLFICLERDLTLELIRAMAEKKPERVVCLDEGFAGNDQLKANALQIFKTKGVTSFKTV